MDKFSNVVKTELIEQKMSISDFAVSIGKSPQYIYDILSRRNNCRWNEDLIDLACKVLGLELDFKKKEA